MAFKLEVIKSYEDDVSAALDYICDCLASPIAARNLRAKLRHMITLIKDNPFIFPLYHDERLAKLGYRFTAVGNYLLFYRVDEAQKIIYITHLFNGRQNIQKLI